MSAVEAATQYAALSAMGAAIATHQKQAAEDIVRFADEQGITKGELQTPLGPVTLAANKASTTVVVRDETALIEWCRQHLPSAIIQPAPRINEQSRTVLLTERFVRVGGQVVDSQSGEVLDFMDVRHTPASGPTVRYGASDTQREVKSAAAKVVAVRVAELTDTIVTAHVLAKAIEAGIDE